MEGFAGEHFSRRCGYTCGAMGVLAISVLLFASVAHSGASAEELPQPTGDVLLVIDGDISRTNVGDEAHFDLEMLQALPPHEVQTHTPWEDGLNQFAGTRLSDLLATVGAGSEKFMAVGVDDYQAEFHDIDLQRFAVLVAWEHNGELMTLRQLGPLRIMFPFDDYPELDSHSSRAMAVWQLTRMTVL